MMWISKLRSVSLLGLLLTALSGLNGEAKAAAPPPTVVITLDYRGGMLIRPATPYMQIFSNGQVVVTNIDGTQKHARLTPLQLRQLHAFVVGQERFLTLSSAQIANAIAAQKPMFVIGDGTTTTISLRVSKTATHAVSVYAADTYLGAFPNIKPLAEFVAIEQRLQQIANTAR
jgi:hypothetical protein